MSDDDDREIPDSPPPPDGGHSETDDDQPLGTPADLDPDDAPSPGIPEAEPPAAS